METLVTPLIPFMKVFAAFAVMLIGIRLKLSIGLAILAGSVALALMCAMPVSMYAGTALKALSHENFHFLAVIIGLILILSDALERSGQSKRLMDALAGYLVSPRLRLIFFPALIGLLPMPGGAVFSAPMVKTVSGDMRIRNSDRALVNYWFRHVWEVCWPLYPGIILTVALADITLLDLIGKTWPGTLVMLAVGWWFFLRPSVLGYDDIEVAPAPKNRSFTDVLRQGAPLLTAIGGAVALETVIAGFLPSVPFEWGVALALTLGVGVVLIQNTDLGFSFLLSVMKKPGLWSMMLVVTAIFIFKDVMQAAGVVQDMADSAGGEAALIASAVLLPFLVGMVAGINIAFVGATFPLLLGILAALGMQDQTIPYLILATFAGFTGVMVSPIHICLILTCQYFDSDLMAAWRKLILPCLLLFLSGVALFVFWT